MHLVVRPLAAVFALGLLVGPVHPISAQEEPATVDLAWRFTVGDRIRVHRVAEVRTKINLAFDGVDAPPQDETTHQRQVGTLTVSDVQPDGSSRVSIRFEQMEQSSDGAMGVTLSAKRGDDDEWIVDVDASALGPPEVAAQMKPMLERFLRNMVETTMSGTLAPDGTITDVSADGDLYAGVPAMLRSVLEQGFGLESTDDLARANFESLFPRLPGKRVAAGHTWKPAESLSFGNMQLDQVGEARLVQRTDGPHVTEDVRYPNAIDAIGEVMASVGELSGTFFDIGKKNLETSKVTGLSVVDAETGALVRRHIQGKVVEGTMELTVSAAGGAPLEGSAEIDLEIDESVTYKRLSNAPTTPSEGE